METALEERMDKITIRKTTLNISNIILMLIVLFSAFRATIFIEVLGLSDRVFLILISLFLCTFVIQFFLAEKEDKVMFLKDHIFVIVYLGIRCVLFALHGFDHYILGSIIYETTFLLLICRWTVGSYEKVKKIFIVFIGFNLVMNLLSAGSVIFMETLSKWGVVLSMYHETSGYMEAYPYAGLFLNPNNAGIMTAMALCLFLFMLKAAHGSKKYPIWEIIGMGIYILFSLYMLYQYGCRSADIGLIAVLLVYGLAKVSKWNKKRFLQICLIGVILCNVVLLAVIASGADETSERIAAVNTLSTGRYKIWNDGYHTAMDTESWLLGQGSNELELENRNAWLKEQWIAAGYDASQYVETTLGLHSGYLSILFNAGIICSILFVIILWQKIGRMRFRSESSWYLVVVFALAVNLFESLLIMNRSYVCFLMMIVLAMGDTEEMKHFGEKDESENIDYHSGI